VARLQRSTIFIHGSHYRPRHFRWAGPTITMRPDEESRFGDLRSFKGLSLWSVPQNRQIGRQGNHCWRAWPPIVSRLIKALKLTGRRRFALRAVASCLCLHHPLIGDDLLLASPAVTPVIAPDQFATHSLVTTGP